MIKKKSNVSDSHRKGFAVVSVIVILIEISQLIIHQKIIKKIQKVKKKIFKSLNINHNNCGMVYMKYIDLNDDISIFIFHI